MSKYSNTSGLGTADWFLGAVKSNPECLLLLAAGCALLLRKSRSTERTQHRHYSQEYERQSRENPRDDISHQSRAGDWADEASRVAGNAREYASSVGKAVSQTAGNYAAAVSEYADGTREKVVEQSRRLAEQAQSKVQSLVQEQPLAVALAGLAAGAAIATAFPATTWERRAFGPAGQRLSEAAETAREKISEATSAAGERLMGAAKERGLSAEGLKEVAREVASSIAGEQKKASETSRAESSGISGPHRSTGSSNPSGQATGTQASFGRGGDPSGSGTNKTG
jgi:hypothetical protein